MKLKRCHIGYDRVPDEQSREVKDGYWVKASDAEKLELAVERATANMIAAQNRAAELEKALRDIVERHDGEYSCDCEVDGEVIIFCDACIAKKALEAK